MYSVKIIYKYSVENGDCFYEESIMLFHAASFDEAYEKAEQYVENYMEKEYKNMRGESVTQSVVSYADCFEIIEEEDATEVYSSYMKNRYDMEPDDYLKLITDTCSKEELLDLRHW